MPDLTTPPLSGGPAAPAARVLLVLVAMLTSGLTAGEAAAAARFKAVTRDADADGRVDRIVLTHLQRARSRNGLSVTVQGYRVLGIASATRATRATVRLAERRDPDTSATPRVAIARGAVAVGDSTRALDRAPPVPTAAVAMNPSAATHISTEWSEAVRLDARKPTAFRLQSSGTALVVGTVSTRRIELGPARFAMPTWLTYKPVGRASKVRDQSGNMARVRRVKVIPERGGTPKPTPEVPDPSGPSVTGPDATGPAPGGHTTPATGATPPSVTEPQPNITVANPIDPSHLTGLAFGDRSHWLQPWRAYLDTPPAATLRKALGVNFDVDSGRAAKAAALLRRSGFRRARIEVGWCDVGYDDPSALRDVESLRTRLRALVTEGIRPLVLLNAHHGCPGPLRSWRVNVTRAAQRGARSIEVDPASASQIRAGLSGLNAQDDYKAASVLFTSVDASSRVTLSKALPSDLEIGAHPASTLRHRPFERPLQSDGQANPDFEATLQGWLRYVDTVTGEVGAAVGGDDYDVEIWNELSFGSDFLDASTYYEPAPAVGTGDTMQVLLDRTVAWLRDPAHGRSRVGIGSGFSNQRPWDSGATGPRGLTALDKHPYPPMRRFPTDSVANGIRPLDALGRPDGDRRTDGQWVDRFTPEYRTLYPEYALSAIQTESLVRDIAPITTEIYGTPHGRNAGLPGSPGPQVWLTEMNIEQAAFAREAATSSPSDIARFQAKVALRTLTAFVNKGVTAVDFYAATAPEFALIDPGFWSTASDPTSSVAEGGATMLAMQRLMQAVDGPSQVGAARPLTLESIGDFADRAEWSGDGTAAHPSLMHRDLLAFLPFQTDAATWAVPIYVMTQDMARRRGGTGPQSFDLPEERYRLRIGGVDGRRVNARALDPLDGDTVPVEVVGRTADSVVVDVRVTDSPRVLLLSESAGG